jgi:chaperone required for assembly of F1-ATPase
MQKGFHEPVEKPRRFYKTVGVAEVEGGYAVTLDQRNVRTPKGGLLLLPSRAAAEQVVAEWAGQGEVLEVAGMHATRLANTALDSIPAAREATAGQVADYAASDLVCYFADQPEGLALRQAEAWDPVLERAERELALHFVRASGIVHQTQPPETLNKVRAVALELDDFALAGLAFGAALYGSAVLAIAVQRGWLGGDAAFELSRIDEAWQEEQWGVDEEAAERVARLRLEAQMLGRWFANLG